MKKVAFFFRTPDCGREWSFEVNRQSLSGTDATLLNLVNEFRKETSYELCVFGATEPNPSVPYFDKADSLLEAAKKAEKKGYDFFIFNAGSYVNQKTFFVHGFGKMKLIAWAQNPPSYDWCTVANNNKNFSRLVTVSNVQRQGLVASKIYSKTVTIHNFIDLDYWKFCSRWSDNLPRYAYVGALKPSKGFHHLARAWPDFKSNYPHAKLDVFGSPGLYGATERLGVEGIAEADYERQILAPLGGSRTTASKLGVNFRGSVSKSVLNEEVRKAKAIVVNPSYQKNESVETFCVSAIEAMALGTFVIGGRAGGLIETVGGAGKLVKGASELSNALFEVENLSENELSGITRNARTKVEDYFTKELALAKWISLLEDGDNFRNPDLCSAFRPAGYVARTIFRLFVPQTVANFIRNI